MVDEYIIGVRNTVSLVLLGISLGLFIVGAAIFAYKKFRQSKYVRTRGTVVDFAQRVGKNGFVYAPIVEIVVKGKKYRATSRVGSSWSAYTRGDELDVDYDPTNPHRMVFGSSFRRNLVPFIFAVQGVAWLFVTYLVFFMLSSFGVPNATRNILTGAFGFLAFALLLTAVIIFFIQKSKRSNFVKTKGKIVGFANRPGDVGDFLYAPIVEISVKGKKYRATSSLASSHASHAVGDEVYVEYDSKNPHSMVFGGWIRRHMLPFVFACFGLLWLFIAGMVFIIMS